MCFPWRVNSSTQWDQVMHICVTELEHHWLRQWLGVCSTPIHYINLFSFIINRNSTNRHQWNYSWNSNIHLKKMHLLMWCAKCGISKNITVIYSPDSEIHGANMGPTWVLSAPDRPHVGAMNLAIRVIEWMYELPWPCEPNTRKDCISLRML